MRNRICLCEEGKEFIWGDNWWQEGEESWFVSGEMNCLFRIEENSREAIYVSRLPSRSICEFRKNPRCLKNNDVIFCFPDEGEFIWCYHLNDDTWKSINIDNPENIRLSCFQTWIVQSELFIISNGLRKIIELNIDEQKIERYYDLETNEISGSVLVNNHIYILDVSLGGICKFNCLDKSIKKYLLTEINEHLNTLCFDGHRFWMSGRKKRIYIWSEAENEIISIDDFPDSFGIYNFSGKYQKILNCEENQFDVPLFLYSVYAEGYVWFIPFQTNEILCIERDTFRMRVFPVKNENQTEESLTTQLLGHKYVLEYVREKRYIGLYSLKNRYILEIDAKKFAYNTLNYKLSADSAAQIIMELDEEQQDFFEQENLNLQLWTKCLLLRRRKTKKNSDREAIGKKIFCYLNGTI